MAEARGQHSFELDPRTVSRHPHTVRNGLTAHLTTGRRQTHCNRHGFLVIELQGWQIRRLPQVVSPITASPTANRIVERLQPLDVSAQSTRLHTQAFAQFPGLPPPSRLEERE
ncbi:hypothetical protein GCM10009691_22050 [Brevibacterium picturae]|uniref:Uncharacterized protein n=1 Tax=Brevibacterium picturae TaxID=260553 RepID=A0ABN2BTF6_9MICO